MRRHLLQLVHQVLPISVLVLAVGFVVSVIVNPAVDPTNGADVREPARVGLLPVVSADETGEGLAFDPAFAIPRPLDLVRIPVAARFDMPLGSPLGAMTLNSQPFLTSRHLGDDLNGIGGRDSGRGDPVHAAADGEIVFSGWAGDGWGHVVMLLHRLPTGERLGTLYGHLDRIRLPAGVTVRRGERIGTVGNADGRHLAHLHFEVRRAESLDPGPGFEDVASGRQSGEQFIADHRGAPADRQNRPLGGAWDTRVPKAVGAETNGGSSIRISTDAPTGNGKPSAP